MFLRRQLLNALTAFFLTALCQGILAEVAAADNAINNLYENLLQREYAGPVVFPNHQVERKAQRSPSLRLRFGRRTDPNMILPPSAEKRWFGDVNQKPIRSPSLRLRFGRRSDPNMPMHSNLDMLMNDLAVAENNENALDDYPDAFDGYERVVRKPQRLRWGRSVPYEGGDSRLADFENERARTDDAFNSLINSEKLRNMLLSLHQYEADANNDADSDEFQREVRKPAPLRLRWGRSTGGRGTADVGAVADEAKAQQKKAISPNALNGDSTQGHEENEKQ